MENELICTIAVIKVASRCNLNCSYCYMYNMGDNTYRNQPKFMSAETVELMVSRIAEHCAKHEVEEFMFVFHGGEPLLVDPAWYSDIVAMVHEKFEQINTRPGFVVQTNGVLLDKAWCRHFMELGINVGISLDGTRRDHDHFRKDHAGRGSYDRVLAGVNTAKEVFGAASVIAVININSDPEETYFHLRSLEVSNIHLLLPDANYEQLPPGPEAGFEGPVQDLYAEWLIRIFDLWMDDESEGRPGIRMFDQILRMFWGARPTSDSLGTEKNEVIVIETNGDYESLDSLKICGDGFTKAGANVRNMTLGQALHSELAKLYHLSHQNLCSQCAQCDIQEVCGGGNLPHRYRKDNGFDNPTVYCLTQARLISHIQNQWVERLPPEFVAQSELSKVSYEDLVRGFAQSTANL